MHGPHPFTYVSLFKILIGCVSVGGGLARVVKTKKNKLATLPTPFHHPGRRLPRVPLVSPHTLTHTSPPTAPARLVACGSRFFSQRAQPHAPPPACRPATRDHGEGLARRRVSMQTWPNEGRKRGVQPTKKKTRTIASSAPHCSPTAAAPTAAPHAPVHHTVLIHTHTHTHPFIPRSSTSSASASATRSRASRRPTAPSTTPRWTRA